MKMTKLCPGYMNDYSKCLHPKELIKSRIQTSFKNEPYRYQNVIYCNWKKYWGPTTIILKEITRQEHNKMIKENTYCTKGKQNV